MSEKQGTYKGHSIDEIKIMSPDKREEAGISLLEWFAIQLGFITEKNKYLQHNNSDDYNYYTNDINTNNQGSTFKEKYNKVTGKEFKENELKESEEEFKENFEENSNNVYDKLVDSLIEEYKEKDTFDPRNYNVEGLKGTKKNEAEKAKIEASEKSRKLEEEYRKKIESIRREQFLLNPNDTNLSEIIAEDKLMIETNCPRTKARMAIENTRLSYVPKTRFTRALTYVASFGLVNVSSEYKIQSENEILKREYNNLEKKENKKKEKFGDLGSQKGDYELFYKRVNESLPTWLSKTEKIEACKIASMVRKRSEKDTKSFTETMKDFGNGMIDLYTDEKENEAARKFYKKNLYYLDKINQEIETESKNLNKIREEKQVNLKKRVFLATDSQYATEKYRNALKSEQKINKNEIKEFDTSKLASEEFYDRIDDLNEKTKIFHDNEEKLKECNRKVYDIRQCNKFGYFDKHLNLSNLKKIKAVDPTNYDDKKAPTTPIINKQNNKKIVDKL